MVSTTKMTLRRAFQASATLLVFAFAMISLLQHPKQVNAADATKPVAEAASDVKKRASKLRAEGDSLLVSGDATGALAKYAQAIALEPNEVKNYLKSYRANDRLKRSEASLKDLSSAIEIDREGTELGNTLPLRANLYSTMGKCYEAAKDYEQLMRVKPSPEYKDNAERFSRCADLLARAEALLQGHDWEGADQLLTEAIEVSRSNAPDLKKKRARARYHRGAHYECIADAGEVIKIDRNDVELLTLRGQAYYELGELDMALKHAQEALQSDPEYSSAKLLHKTVNGIRRLNTAGMDLMNKKQWKEANVKFEQIMSSFQVPKEVGKNILMQSCKCAGELRDRPFVNRACQKSIEYDGSWIESRIAYAEMLAATSDSPEEWEETVRAWHQALQIDQQNERAQDGLRKAEAALKQSKSKNYYKILGVSRNADSGAIKKAYRELAKLFHPDRHQGLSEEEMKKMQKKFADVAEAYEVLSDPEKKGKYDRGEEVFENQGGGGQDPFQRFHRQHGGGFHFNFQFG